MRLEDCYYLGTITKPHGLKGHVVAKIDTDEPEIYNNLESVFINLNGTPVPFFIKESQLLNSNSLRFIFEDSSIDIQNIIGSDLYLPLNTLPKLEGKQFYYHEVIDFDLIDENNTIIGKIIEINDNSPQPLFNIRFSDEKTLYIPIINDWIIEVNRDNNYISINLPDGLLDL